MVIGPAVSVHDFVSASLMDGPSVSVALASLPGGHFIWRASGEPCFFLNFFYDSKKNRGRSEKNTPPGRKKICPHPIKKCGDFVKKCAELLKNVPCC